MVSSKAVNIDTRRIRAFRSKYLSAHIFAAPAQRQSSLYTSELSHPSPKNVNITPRRPYPTLQRPDRRDAATRHLDRGSHQAAECQTHLDASPVTRVVLSIPSPVAAFHLPRRPGAARAPAQDAPRPAAAGRPVERHCQHGPDPGRPPGPPQVCQGSPRGAPETVRVRGHAGKCRGRLAD